MTPAIETQGLTKRYGRRRGVEDLTLRVDEGEVFGFLGPNGAGKTTTIRLLLGLIRPTRGGASVLGTSLAERTPAYRARIGYLPGDLGLPAHLTGGEFLRRMGSLRKGDPAERTRALADRLELDLSRKIGGLSHGTRQKLAIVQAFQHQPHLLILDEPTNGLDPLAQQTFYDLVREERERGATVFLSSHILGEVERTCSRVGIIREGRLVVVEGIEALKRKRVKWAQAEIRGGSGVDPEAFGRLTGVRSVEVRGRILRLALEGGGCPEVLRMLADSPIENLTIQDASLEEIFLEYYSGAGRAEG